MAKHLSRGLSKAVARSDSLAEYRQLLRHAAHPSSLRKHPLLPSFTERNDLALATLSDAEILSIFASALDRWLDFVTPRQRDIVNRRDLNGESCFLVAKELSLSVRQVIREHNTALATIATHINKAAVAVSSPANDGTDHVNAQMQMCRFLEQTGNLHEAADVLLQIASSTDCATVRMRTELQLASLYTRAGRLTLAAQNIFDARATAHSLENAAVYDAEVDVVAAQHFVAAGNIRVGLDLAHRSSILLSSWVDSICDTSVIHSLITILNLRTELAIGAGKAKDALRINQQGFQLLKRLGTGDSSFAVDCAVWKAIITTLLGDAQSGKEQLLRCYARARILGYLRDALDIATSVAAAYRRCGQATDAFDLLSPLTSTARKICAGEALGGFLLELAGASFEIGLHDDAAKYLDQARRSTVLPWIQASVALADSELSLHAGNFSASLLASEEAETAFARLGRDRLVGSAIRLQAEALFRLGRSEQAMRVMAAAIDVLKQVGPMKRLQAAYETMYAITKNRQYKLLARMDFR